MKTIALTGGSTGGHIFPLLSIYKFNTDTQNNSFVWVWEEYSLEEKIAEKNNIKFLSISAWKLRRYFDFRNIYEPLKNLTGLFQALYYIIKYKIDIIFSKWWYVSLPLCLWAVFFGKKIYIHESDLKIWLSNKLISKFATKIFYSFPNDFIDNKKHILSWPILNTQLIESVKNRLNLKENKKLNVLIIAWTQWSKNIFNAMLKILGDLQDIDFHIILGTKNMEFKDSFLKFSNIKIYDFLEQKDMGKLLKDIDIAITRWSSTTLWELYYFWIHSIIIPITKAWNHQMENASFFKENFSSDLLKEENNLNLEIFRLLQKYKDMRKSWLNLEWFSKSLEIIKKELEGIG